jgi:hypothetical protein
MDIMRLRSGARSMTIDEAWRAANRDLLERLLHHGSSFAVPGKLISRRAFCCTVAKLPNKTPKARTESVQRVQRSRYLSVTGRKL